MHETLPPFSLHRVQFFQRSNETKSHMEHDSAVSIPCGLHTHHVINKYKNVYAPLAKKT